MLNHGGRIKAYAQRYGIAVDNWLDLSTGINPNGWPVPEFIPVSLWSRLPESEDDLIDKAMDYYQCQYILPVAGSQAAIQTLPTLRAPCRVAILSPAYEEHRHCWQESGHEVVALESFELEQQIEQFDVVIVINPNNPTGQTFSEECLLNWHRNLQSRNGWLIVDEAFIDVTAQKSLASLPVQPGLIILRSLGKFFGLAGLRVGFVISHPDLLSQIKEKLGPWPIASASRWIASQALSDQIWQQQSLQYLPQNAQRLAELLSAYGLRPTGGCALFQWIKIEQASQIHYQLAEQGILCRLFDKPVALRFGLPSSEHDWSRLENALQQVMPR
jgi:cobalamin biosynthesis protein CobC